MCAWSSASILVLASSKLLPRTVIDSSSQTPFQPSSSSQKLQSFGTLANTFSLTARAVIDDSLRRFSLTSVEAAFNSVIVALSARPALTCPFVHPKNSGAHLYDAKRLNQLSNGNIVTDTSPRSCHDP